jgi:surface antigen
MTEREIPDGVGFLFGGMTDASIAQSAPPALSEPENGSVPVRSVIAGSVPVAARGVAGMTVAPIYSSRREARAAGAFPMDAATAASATAASAPAVPAAPAYDGIAALFPLLGDAASSPLDTEAAAPSAFDAIVAPPPDLGATQAIPAAEIAAELSTPVGPYVVPQSAPVPIVRSWHTADVSAAPGAGAPAAAAPSDAAAADPFVASRRQHAAPAKPGRGAGSSRRSTARGTTARTIPARSTPARTTAHRDADPKPLRQRLFGVGVMVAVGGLFAVLAIPAYADNDAATLHAAAAVQTQKVAVANAAASTVTTTARDSYTATSAADLKSLYAAAMREQNLAAYLQSGAKAKGDDYPWFAELDRAQGGGLSPLGYYYRECVDFVAWRLNRDAGTTSAPFRWTWSKLTPNGGDGHQWKAAWLAHGWPTGTTPVPGSVAWFGNNHVGYVNGILDNGQVLIEEYNYVPHAYGTRVINASDAYYLYAPPK